MNCFVLLAVVVMLVGVRSERPNCEVLQVAVFICCKEKDPKMLPPDNARQECTQMRKKLSPCNVELCTAKKRGFVSPDGSFDKKMMAADVEKRFRNDTQLVNALKNNCIYGDINKFGPIPLCYLLKQKLCFEVELIKSCDEWDNTGKCRGMKTLADNCVSFFDE